MLHDWYWQLQAAAQGPDWSFSATFAPANAEHLTVLIRQYGFPGFAYSQVIDGRCLRHHHTSTYDLYIDQRNYATLAANLAGDQRQNIWVYHTIEVCGSDLTIERGYGG